MKKVNDISIWRPNYVIQNVLELDTNELRKTGITHIVFDLDDTLVPRRRHVLSVDHVHFIASLKTAGFAVLIGSNTRRNISPLAQMLNVEAIVPAGISIKPFASFYKRVVAAADTEPERIAMVGDHILNDVIGGNLAGLTTVWTLPLNRTPGPLRRAYLRLALGRTQKL